jgi:apolipoprotein D and lipocalin family protein
MALFVNRTKPIKMIRQMMFLAISALFMVSCGGGIPNGAEAIRPFDKERYLGKWYEIARLDSKFERGLNNTTAEYSLNDNGSIRVKNKGFNYTEEKWQEAIGKAKIIGKDGEARLKVSFFGPFYGSYNVIALDEDYKYALVCGGDLKYLWILSREMTVPEVIKSDYLKIAEDIGFDTAALVWVTHDKSGE